MQQERYTLKTFRPRRPLSVEEIEMSSWLTKCTVCPSSAPQFACCTHPPVRLPSCAVGGVLVMVAGGQATALLLKVVRNKWTSLRHQD